MPRLLTDEQAAVIAGEFAEKVAWRIDADRPLVMSESAFFNQVKQAIEHDLTDTLEGLMEPDEAAA